MLETNNKLITVGKVLLVYEMSIQVFPTAPSPTVTHLMNLAVLIFSFLFLFVNLCMCLILMFRREEKWWRVLKKVFVMIRIVYWWRGWFWLQQLLLIIICLLVRVYQINWPYTRVQELIDMVLYILESSKPKKFPLFICLKIQTYQNYILN